MTNDPPSMNTRELILLSPYRLPSKDALMLANDDVACFLNGYIALWHPDALRGAGAPPHLGSPYDHEQPNAGHVYAVPESPPLVLPDDWHEHVRAAGAVAFKATADRDATLANLHTALLERAAEARLQRDSDPEKVRPFFGIGFGYLMIEGLAEAMDHQDLLTAPELWQEIQGAVTANDAGDSEGRDRQLHSAAERLLAAREVLYPATIHLLDLGLLHEPAAQTADQSSAVSQTSELWGLPASLDRGQPVNLIAAASLVERLGREQPERLAALRERLAAESAEVCGGPYIEREDALLPLESQLWNLRRGMAAYKELLDYEVRVFARKRFAFHPQLPLLLSSVGLTRALLLAFDDAVVPSYRSCVINWPSPDGKQVEAFTRVAYPADTPQTFFHIAHYLHRTIMEDHAATLVLQHGTGPAASWYLDWLELSRFAPVLGQWTTFSRHFNDVQAGEYVSAVSPDEFHADYLSERIAAHSEEPVSWFPRHVAARRKLDTAWTLMALRRSLGPAPDEGAGLEQRLTELEKRIEVGDSRPGDASALDEAGQQAADALAQRLVARASGATPGYLFLNPCSFTRRLAVELDDFGAPVPLGGPLKALQLDGHRGRLVVEVPALGFAWVPRSGPPETPMPAARMRLADERNVRNEFFEAAIDPNTGGLQGIRDHRSRVNRLGQQLVYNPGSTMRASKVSVTSNGPALGEVISEGVILDDQGQETATFRQRFRAWLGRPVLELRIDISFRQPPVGYPWHAYFGSRFAWRDDRMALMRGVNGTGYVTTHTRPESPDYLDLRLGRESTVILTAGLPFHQKHGGRMLDVILIPEGETTRTFDLGIGLDRDYPMRMALGMCTPAPVVRTAKGPPHVGASGWLFHLDLPNVVLTTLRPGEGGGDAVVARLFECAGHSGQVELRCVRDPTRATLLDARGTDLLEARTEGDAAVFDVTQGDVVQLRIEFS
jgi:alpha-mannosidase